MVDGNDRVVWDLNHELREEPCLLDDHEGVARRAIWVVDPDGLIRFVYAINAGRGPGDLLRVLADWPESCSFQIASELIERPKTSRAGAA